MYNNPDIKSSYKDNDLGRTLYNEIRRLRPNIVIDFGVLDGYSTVAMAQAVKDNGTGKVIACDIFENYRFAHANLDKLKKNLTKYHVDDVVEIREQNFFDWIKNPSEFDFAHIDISNTGDIIDMLRDKFKDTGKHVYFEGGSEQRDRVGWMIIYNKRPFKYSRDAFEIIDKRFPSLSKLKT